MAHPLRLDLAAWLTANPPPSRDIRKLYADFPTPEKAEEERDKRISILKTGRSPSSAHLARLLEDAPKGQVAHVGCCPVLARQFQIWFVGAALELQAEIGEKGNPYTLLDLNEAVDTSKLHKINWRRLHARLRKRIGRLLGEHVVVIGVGEVEYDESRRKWQPHYHLMIYGANVVRMRELRTKHYRAKRTGPRPMKRSTLREPAKWFSYMSKLIAFGKQKQASGRVLRVRLHDDLSRAYFRYLGSRTPTSFIFCVNCSVVKQGQRMVMSQSDEMEDYVQRKPAGHLPVSPWELLFK